MFCLDWMMDTTDPIVFLFCFFWGTWLGGSNRQRQRNRNRHTQQKKNLKNKKKWNEKKNKPNKQGVRFDPDIPQTIRLEFAKSNTKVSKPKQQSSPPAAAPHPTLLHPLTGREYFTTVTHTHSHTHTHTHAHWTWTSFPFSGRSYLTLSSSTNPA